MDGIVLGMLQFGELGMPDNSEKKNSIGDSLDTAGDRESRIVMFGLFMLVCPLHVVIILRPHRVNRWCRTDELDKMCAFARAVVDNQHSTGRLLSFTDGDPHESPCGGRCMGRRGGV